MYVCMLRWHSIQCIKESTRSFVLDAEAVAIDRTTGKLMPFQELSRRKRKDVKVEDIEVCVCLFAFDLLYLNGEVSFFFSCWQISSWLSKFLALVTDPTGETSWTVKAAFRCCSRGIRFCQVLRWRNHGRNTKFSGRERQRWLWRPYGQDAWHWCKFLWTQS